MVKAAIDEALAAADPDRDSLYEHMYGDPATAEQFAPHALRRGPSASGRG